MAITDLTGTTWTLNNGVVAPTSTVVPLVYNVNCKSYGDYFDELLFDNSDHGQLGLGASKYWVYSNNGIGDHWVQTTGGYGSYDNAKYKTITFTGGTDATNTDLISWLQANATLIGTTTVEKSIQMHPIVDGALDTNTNLYPKTTIENVAMSDAQQSALDSGITSDLVAQIGSGGGTQLYQHYILVTAPFSPVSGTYVDYRIKIISPDNYSYTSDNYISKLETYGSGDYTSTGWVGSPGTDRTYYSQISRASVRNNACYFSCMYYTYKDSDSTLKFGEYVSYSTSSLTFTSDTVTQLI